MYNLFLVIYFINVSYCFNNLFFVFIVHLLYFAGQNLYTNEIYSFNSEQFCMSSLFIKSNFVHRKNVL